MCMFFFLLQGFKCVLEQMSDLETDVPLIKTYVAGCAAYAVCESIVTLQELAEPMENGTYYPLFLISLQQILKFKDKDWLVNVFNESKMDLQNMLPGAVLFQYICCELIYKFLCHLCEQADILTSPLSVILCVHHKCTMLA